MGQEQEPSLLKRKRNAGASGKKAKKAKWIHWSPNVINCVIIIGLYDEYTVHESML